MRQAAYRNDKITLNLDLQPDVDLHLIRLRRYDNMNNG